MAVGQRRLLWGGVLGPLILFALLVSVWAIDTGSASGQVVRNVEVAGMDVGGLDEDRLSERLSTLAEDLGDRPVQIETPEVTYPTTAAEIGLTLDVEATAEIVLDAGRGQALPVRPFAWLAGFFSPTEVGLRFTANAETARAALRQLEGDALVSPQEPTIESVDGAPFDVVPGEPGSGIEPEALAVALAAAAEETPLDEPIEVRIRQSDLQPRLDDSIAAAAAAEANEMTAEPMVVRLGESQIEIAPEQQRGWLVALEREEGIEIGIDTELIAGYVTDALAGTRTEPQDASFTVEAGRVVLVPSQPGTVCCTEQSAAAVEAALRSPSITSVDVEARSLDADLTTADAEALGIVEEVGSPDAFGPTTNHRCCQNRVTNIHRIADIVRGAVILPGETFSVNDYVGRRTREKGFVAAGVIYDGELQSDVGGGVSQFATTLFNAALYAGLDFGEYQSHSLYFSRYPRGHEATISFPAPDLEIVNSSPYGVLLWPTYTDTSITVRLYSTAHAQVTLGNPTSRPQGNCTRWTTPRTHAYPDGTTETDTVFAVYRPGEGIDC